jgi:hypothetical protein
MHPHATKVHNSLRGNIKTGHLSGHCAGVEPPSSGLLPHSIVRILIRGQACAGLLLSLHQPQLRWLTPDNVAQVAGALCNRWCSSCKDLFLHDSEAHLGYCVEQGMTHLPYDSEEPHTVIPHPYPSASLTSSAHFPLGNS